MDKMKYNHEHDEELFRYLIKDLEPEVAPDSIKTDVMNRVFQDWSSQPIKQQPLINRTNRLWIIGGVAILLALTFLMDASLLASYWRELNIDLSAYKLGEISQSFSQFFKTISSLPSILLFVGFGILALLGIDRFFNRLANIN